MLSYLRKKSTSQDSDAVSGKENTASNMKPQSNSSYAKAFSAKTTEGGGAISADDDWGPITFGGSGGAQPAAAEDPTERQREYIAMLQERNRLKKELEKSSKTRSQQSQEALENGFKLNLLGANSSPSAPISSSKPSRRAAADALSPPSEPQSKAAPSSSSSRREQPASAGSHAPAAPGAAKHPSAAPGGEAEGPEDGAGDRAAEEKPRRRRWDKKMPESDAIRRGEAEGKELASLESGGVVPAASRAEGSLEQSLTVEDHSDSYSDEEFEKYEATIRGSLSSLPFSSSIASAVSAPSKVSDPRFASSVENLLPPSSLLRSSSNPSNPPTSEGAAPQISSSSSFLPLASRARVSVEDLGLTPLKRPSSARARALKADGLMSEKQPFASLKMKQQESNVSKDKSKMAGQKQPGVNESVTGALLDQIKGLTKEQREKLMAKLAGGDAEEDEEGDDDEDDLSVEMLNAPNKEQMWKEASKGMEEDARRRNAQVDEVLQTVFDDVSDSAAKPQTKSRPSSGRRSSTTSSSLLAQPPFLAATSTSARSSAPPVPSPPMTPLISNRDDDGITDSALESLLLPGGGSPPPIALASDGKSQNVTPTRLVSAHISGHKSAGTSMYLSTKLGGAGGREKEFDRGFGKGERDGLSSTDSTPTKSQLEQNDILEQSFESLSRFNALGRSRGILAGAALKNMQNLTPSPATSSTQHEQKQPSPPAAVAILKPSPNQTDRKAQAKNIMQQIADAEKSIFAASAFSSSEEEEDEEDGEKVGLSRTHLKFGNSKTIKQGIANLEPSSSIASMSIDSTIASLVDRVLPADGDELRSQMMTMMSLTAPLDASISLTNEDMHNVVYGKQENSSFLESSLTQIPVLPSGRMLDIDILSTWGDPHYVGLCGVELFDEIGEPISPEDNFRDVVCSPSSVNVLPGYGGADPRTSDKIFDGACHTCSDLHAWLTPWGMSENVNISVDLSEEKTLSMIRIWNYNKNRQHSYRGARMVRIRLDGVVIFEGEIRKACGGLGGPDECSDAVLFTTDENILNRIEDQDESKYPEFRSQVQMDVSETLVQRIKRDMESNRPRTADGAKNAKNDGKSGLHRRKAGDEVERVQSDFGASRPITRAGGRATASEQKRDEVVKMPSADKPSAPKKPETLSSDEEEEENDDDDDELNAMLDELGGSSPISMKGADAKAKKSSRDSPSLDAEIDAALGMAAATSRLNSLGISLPSGASPKTFSCDGIVLKIHSTHEGQVDKTLVNTSYEKSSGAHASKYVGLTRIKLIKYDKQTKQLVEHPIAASELDAIPRDLHSLGYEGDARRVGNLISGGCGALTTEDRDMWLVPDSITGGVAGADGSVEVRVKFGGRVNDLWGIQVWNYNKVSKDGSGKVDKDTFDEDSLRGVKVVSVSLRNCEERLSYQCGAFEVRRAPSSAAFDYGQTLEFGMPHAVEAEELLGGGGGNKLTTLFQPCLFNARQDYETPFLPAGQLVKIVIHSSWGDPYYVGMDSIEFFNVRGGLIQMSCVSACPFGLRSIGQSSDSRVPENLVRGAPGSSWLAPLAASVPVGTLPDAAPGHESENVLFFGCEGGPQHFAAMRIKNYSRTPARGVRDFSVWIDGLLVYRGYMERCGEKKGREGHAILFSGCPKAVAGAGVRDKTDLFYCGGESQDVMCIDEGVVKIRSKMDSLPPDPCAEGVSADLTKRPKTSMVGGAKSGGR